MSHNSGENIENMYNDIENNPKTKIFKKNKSDKNTSFSYILLLIILNLLMGCGIFYAEYKLLIAPSMNKTNNAKSNIKLMKVKDYAELSKVGGDLIINLIKSKPNAVLGLATGSTPIGLYKYLIEKYNKKEISFKQTKSFNLDEYCGLPRNHSQTYYTFMMENLFSHIDINLNNVHIPNSEGLDIEKKCQDYNKELSTANIDLQILGIGVNGHIGFNEPGTSFDSIVHETKLSEQTRKDNSRFFDNDINKVPQYAITMGIKNIMDAKTIVLLASGKNKAVAIQKLIEEEPTTELPASALKLHKGEVIVIADEEACSLLKK